MLAGAAAAKRGDRASFGHDCLVHETVPSSSHPDRAATAPAAAAQCSGKSKWGLSEWGLKVLVHNCP